MAAFNSPIKFIRCPLDFQLTTIVHHIRLGSKANRLPDDNARRGLFDVQTGRGWSPSPAVGFIRLPASYQRLELLLKYGILVISGKLYGGAVTIIIKYKTMAGGGAHV